LLPNEVQKVGILGSLRLSPKYFFTLIILGVLSVSERIPKNKEELESGLQTLKESNLDLYLGLEKAWNQIRQEDLDERLKVLDRTSKSDFISQNRMTLIHALLSDDQLTHASSDPILGEFVKHIASIIDPEYLRSVFDPAFGAGTLLYSAFNGSKGPDTEIDYDEVGNEVEVRRFIAKKIVGLDINPDVCKFAAQLGKLLGFEANIFVGNALESINAHPELHDLVVCEPPAGMRIEESLVRQDWPFGRPAKSSIDWAWAQIVQRHIASMGYGLLFVPSGALFRTHPNDVLVRAKMVGSGAIRAVFNLPSGMSQAHRLNMSLIIFGPLSDRPKLEAKILFVDISEPTSRKGSFEYVKSVLEKIHDACNVFEDVELGIFKPELGYSATLSVSDPQLMKNDMNLNPSLYVTQMIEGINTKINMKKDISVIEKTISEFLNLIGQAEDELSNFMIKADFVNLGELIANGKIVQVIGMSKNDLKSNRILGVKYDADSGKRLGLGDTLEKNIPYISVQDIRNPGKLAQSGVLRPDIVMKENELIQTKPGDVVFIKTGKPAAKVDLEGNKNLFSPLSVLRITDEGKKTISPEVLAFVLNGERVKKFMQGSTIGRLQIEAIPIPIMDPEITGKINNGLQLVQKLLLKSMSVNLELFSLKQKLNQILAGELEGLEDKL